MTLGAPGRNRSTRPERGIRTGIGMVRSGSRGARLGGSHSGSGASSGEAGLGGWMTRADGAPVGGSRSGPLRAIS